MVKITIEPTRLKKFLSQVLAYKSGAPIAEASLLVFTPKGVSVQCSLASDIILFAEYSDKFFMKFSCKAEEYFMATARLIKERLAYGFNGAKMTVTTDETNISLIGEDTDDHVTEKLVVVDKNLVSPFSAKMSDLGLVPTRRKRDPKTQQPTEEIEPMPFAIQCLIPVSKFTDLPPNEELKIVSDGKTLKIVFEDELGSRDRPIPIRKTEGKLEVCEVGFNKKIVEQLTSQFDGEVWLNVNPGMMCLSQINKDYSLSYVFAAKEA